MAIRSQRSSDPIARNAKDVNTPEDAVQTAEVTSSSLAPIRAESIPLLPGQRWEPYSQARTSSSAIDLLVSMLRFKWTIVAVFVLVSAPLVAGIWTLMVPQYQARAEVRVRPIIPRLIYRMEENGTIPFYDSFVNTQVSVVRSPTVLQRVLDQSDIKATSWYKDPPRSLMDRLHGAPVPAMERLRGSLAVRPRPRTEIIDISFTDPKAGDARRIVDAVLDQYIKYIGERSDASEEDIYRKLAEEYSTLEKDIQGRELICASLHRQLGTELPQELISAKRLRLDETEARLSEVRSRIAILEWEKARIPVVDGNEAAVASASGLERTPAYHTDSQWRTLDLDVRTLDYRIANSVYASNHPEHIRMTKELEFKKELRRLREAQLDEQWWGRMRDVATMIAMGARTPGAAEGTVPVEYQLARAQREEQLLQTALEAQRAEFKELFATAQSLERENNMLQHKRKLFEAVRERLYQKDVERRAAGSITIAMSAFVPSKPQQDRRIVFTAMALFMGLGLGGAAAFLRVSRDQAIYTPKDMPETMQAPLLGHMPLIPTRRLLGGPLSDEFGQCQLSLIESVRVMRTALLLRLNGRDKTSVLITSATTGTGKSSFAIILGKSLAQAGKSVLMIDADFHKMSLSKRFDLLDRPGFIDALSGRTVGTQHIFPTETPGLSIMPGGQRTNGDVVVEEIANGAFKTCINQLAQQYEYDLVLLDGSPILSVADAAILAGQVNGTIMVEREQVSQRTDAAEALARLRSTGGHLLGTVFVGSAGPGGYKYGYDFGLRM